MKKYNKIILSALLPGCFFLAGCKEDMDLSGKIYMEIETKLNTFLHALYPSLSGSFGAFVHAVAVLVICCVAIAWAYGHISKTKEVGISVLWVSIFFPMLYSGDLYFSWVVEPIGAQRQVAPGVFCQRLLPGRVSRGIRRALQP